MKWTVYCVQQASDDLAEIWLNAADRQSITSAANDIDTELRRSPETAGESRDGNRRILFSSPLAVTFDFDPVNLLVLILDIRLVKRSK